MWEHPPKNILIVTKINDAEVLGYFEEIVAWLHAEKHATIIVEHDIYEKYSAKFDFLQTQNNGCPQKNICQEEAKILAMNV